ncbi:MAG: hypothetical protein DRP89_02480 [Candidatus Neomarinimicrobiota bacterium]|nr:MAG: hypothetical protein DRP89_02480 [Candidatus Neomarinimicrobiota bacterium]
MLKDIYTDTKIPFIEGYFYHVFNRGNNREKIFYDDENCKYFLRKFDEYLSEYLNVYAFCLLPNHFHFLVKVKKLSKPCRFKKPARFNNKVTLTTKPCRSERPTRLEEKDDLNKIIIQLFSNFFNSYSKSINKQENRHGSLFEKHFKRKIIDSEEYLSRIIFYIHLNPVYHHVCQSFENYQWSSYKKILNRCKSKLSKKEVLEYFSGRENYIFFHREHERDFKEIEKYLIE